MRTRKLLVPLCLLALLTAAGCEAEPEPDLVPEAEEDATAGSPRPDTFPVTGVGDALPEGMPLPPGEAEQN